MTVELWWVASSGGARARGGEDGGARAGMRNARVGGGVMVWRDALVLGGVGVSSARVVGGFVVSAVVVRAGHLATSRLRASW